LQKYAEAAFLVSTFTCGKMQDFEALETCWFKAGNILVYPQRQNYNLDVSENSVSTYKSAIYIEKQQQVSAGVIYSRFGVC
jgi:hypothetical protein